MNRKVEGSESIKFRQLLASSATLEGIVECINKFWVSTQYSVDPETLTIRHPTHAVSSNVRVTVQRGRYRFEHIA